MTIAANHIVALSPTPEETDAAVRYAIKSAVPYTYDRMEKDAWRRVARVARGKVNEAMMRRFAAGIGIKTSEQEKSHQQHDSFDFAFTAKRGVLQADIKTFHVLTQFLGQSREPFNISDLLCGENHSSGAWHRFFPMLVPQDYRHHKDIYIFGVSVEASPVYGTAPILPFSWTAFPDALDEAALVDPTAISRRQGSGRELDVSLSWPALGGGGSAVFEIGENAFQAKLALSKAGSLSRKKLASFLAIQLDDDAHARLRRQDAELSLTVTDGTQTIFSAFPAGRFREVFPRQEYVLYLIGWIGREAFVRFAKPLPKGTPCYFYPPR